jgi:VIT1/CCC1 family predicted Fe2+/Mn2+ transporter
MFKFAKITSNLLLTFAIVFVILTSFLVGFSKGFLSGRKYGINEAEKLYTPPPTATSSATPKGRNP